MYDIWVKGNTFPPAILSQLADVLKRADEGAYLFTCSPSIFYSSNLMFSAAFLELRTEMTPNSFYVSAYDEHASSSNSHTRRAGRPSSCGTSYGSTGCFIDTAQPGSRKFFRDISCVSLIIVCLEFYAQFTRSNSNGSQLDATQLALLQQLAHTAASVPSVPQSLPSADSVNVQKFPLSGVNGSSRPMPEGRANVPNEQRYSGYRSSEHESRTTPYFDDRDSIRGRYRGGNFRGRGRGDRFGRNRDGADHRQNDLERDSSPSRSFRGGGRNRSKSPSRNDDRWNSKLTSPLRRPRDISPPSTRTDPSVRRENGPDKDEFGRDIRPESSKSPTHTRSPPLPPISPVLDPRKPSTNASNGPHSTLDENPVTHLSSNKLSSTASATLDSDSKIPELGLETFNPATFDYTSPTSWEALGKLWQVTNGRPPSQEELVQFIVSYGTGMASTLQASDQNIDQQNFTFRGRGRGGGFSRGRVGNGRLATNGWRNEEDSQSCAIVLGGGEDATDDGVNINSDHRTPEPSMQQNQTSVGNTGRMQKVGDKWVFVRGVTADHDIS